MKILVGRKTLINTSLVMSEISDLNMKNNGVHGTGANGKSFFLTGITPYKAIQPLICMELHKKKS